MNPRSQKRGFTLTEMLVAMAIFITVISGVVVLYSGAVFTVRAGYRAIESLRLEKAYRAWGSDIGPDHTPFQAGLGWAVKLKTDIPFLGREALETQQRRPLPRRLAGFTVADPEIVLLGRETLYRNGERCGWLSSAGWGYTIEKSIGLGYVRNAQGVDRAYVLDGRYELEVAGERVPAEVFLAPPYDPRNERVKA